MIRILFKFFIYLSCERALKNGRVKSTILTKSSMNFIFGQGSCLMSDFATPNLNKTILLQISLRFEIVIFNNNFALCVAGFLESRMSSFCSMPCVAGWFLLRSIIKRTNVFYPLCLKKYQIVMVSILWNSLDYTPQLT